MVKILNLIFLFLLSTQCFSQQVSIFKRKNHLTKNPDCCEAAPTYIYKEDFEDAQEGVFLPGWVQQFVVGFPLVGTVEFAYATDPLVGSKSLRLQDGARIYYVGAFDLTSEVYVYFRFKRVTYQDGTTIFNLMSGSQDNTPICSLYLNYNGTLKLIEGAFGSTGYVEISTVGAAAPTDTISIWLHYVAGTGANSLAEVFMALNSETKPASGSSFYTAITNGKSTGSANGIWFYSEYTPSDYRIDKVRVSPDKIGSDPL